MDCTSNLKVVKLIVASENNETAQDFFSKILTSIIIFRVSFLSFLISLEQCSSNCGLRIATGLLKSSDDALKISH